MSWKLKVAMLERAGKTKEEALIEVITQLDAANREMDTRLAKCIEYLAPEQIEEIFGSA